MLEAEKFLTRFPNVSYREALRQYDRDFLQNEEPERQQQQPPASPAELFAAENVKREQERKKEH